jgi:hypothetical protein
MTIYWKTMKSIQRRIKVKEEEVLGPLAAVAKRISLAQASLLLTTPLPW